MGMTNKLTVVEFTNCLPYLDVRVKQSSIAMASQYLVQGLPLTSVAIAHDCTKQNVLGVAHRVLKAHEQYLEAQKRMKT
jgi:hypothetical protein